MNALSSLVPEETALVVVDMQNGYVDPEGGLAQAGMSIPDADTIVDNTAKLVRACHDADIPVLFSRQEHWPDDHTRAKHRLPMHLSKNKLRVAKRGTWDSDIVPALQEEIRSEDHVFVKHRMSCFFDTNLDTKLRMLDASLLIVCGLVTNVCVESTIRDAYFRDYDIMAVGDGMGSWIQDLHDATLKNVRLLFGEVHSTEEMLSLLGVKAAV